MPKRSAGILLHRSGPDGPEVLLVHPGGPFWAKRDAGAWSIPKGEIDPGEEPRAAALREFAEELGTAAPDGELIELGEIRQAGGKTVVAFALAGDLDVSAIRSNMIAIVWPPRSGRSIDVPEIDRAAWFSLAQARTRILAAQAPLLDRLATALGRM
ncbi:NUDIX domain-containing protein [Enterovirga aerilata]|uniref:NUDIX domain-containing protein n=1 Tax=Enterovirga aerilata TaxID=2730920 RepID=A0A849I794_9HYPH|nr:NUDIX domain-containing protein [Enterovirga sp. DB1703]NNM72269.1 NUDIX domain-containing protein [Enterovirga sp. DB1703]